MALEVTDPINPEYYKDGTNLEVIDIILEYDLDFCRGNAIKYILRAGKKTDDQAQDINKAIRYLQFYHRRLERLKRINERANV